MRFRVYGVYTRLTQAGRVAATTSHWITTDCGRSASSYPTHSLDMLDDCLCACTCFDGCRKMRQDCLISVRWAQRMLKADVKENMSPQEQQVSCHVWSTGCPACPAVSCHWCGTLLCVSPPSSAYLDQLAMVVWVLLGVKVPIFKRVISLAMYAIFALCTLSMPHLVTSIMMLSWHWRCWQDMNSVSAAQSTFFTAACLHTARSSGQTMTVHSTHIWVLVTTALAWT